MPFNIILNKKRILIDHIKQKDIYIEVQSLEKFNDIYKQEWESILDITSLNWSDVRTNIHQTKISLDIKSAIYSQIHLGYFSEYLSVKRGTIQSATCKLCHETLSEHYHEILHCRVLFKVLDHFMSLVLGFHSGNLSDEELVFGTPASTTSDWLRNPITFTVRFVVHRSRGTDFRNPEIAETKITKMAKQKIRQKIYNQYYSALEKGCIDKLCENYLLGDILGTMRNNVLKVSGVLEA